MAELNKPKKALLFIKEYWFVVFSMLLIATSIWVGIAESNTTDSLTIKVRKSFIDQKLQANEDFLRKIIDEEAKIKKNDDIIKQANTSAEQKEKAESDNEEHRATIADTQEKMKENRELITRFQEIVAEGSQKSVNLGTWVIIGLIAAIIFLALGFANHSRKRTLKEVDDHNEFGKMLMQQTLGLPQGTVRGILALVVALVYVGTVFLHGENVPDMVKVVTAMMFGYYFAKKSDQVTDATNALLGKSKQRAVLQRDAESALEQARNMDAHKVEKDLYDTATKAKSDGDKKRGQESLDAYQEAIDNANEAKEKAEQKKNEDLVKTADNVMAHIKQLKPDDVQDIRELVDNAHSSIRGGERESAQRTLQQAENKLDVLREHKKQEAISAISEARQKGAEGIQTTAKLLTDAEAQQDSGDNQQDIVKAIQNYQKAATLARDANAQATAKQQGIQKEGFDEAVTAVRSQIRILSPSSARSVQAMLDVAKDTDNVAEAQKIMQRAKQMADRLLDEEQEGEDEVKTWIKKLEQDGVEKPEEKLDEIQEAKEKLDEAIQEEGINGQKMVETLLAIVGNLKDTDAKFIAPLKKRLSGLSLDKEDLEEIFNEIKDAGDLNYLRRSLDFAANSKQLTRNIPDKLKKLLSTPDRLKDLMLGDDETLKRLFQDFGAEVESNDFYTFVNKARKNLVDGKLGDMIKEVLPQGFKFDQYKKIIKDLREKGSGAEKAIGTIVNIADTALDFIPGGGAVKTAAKLVKGLSKLKFW